jgi:hypothetical protein
VSDDVPRDVIRFGCPGDRLVRRAGRAARGSQRDQPLDDELVALLAHDPVPTRDIVAVHRRSMTESPAVSAVLTALAG